MRICRAAQQVNIRELQMCNIDDGGVEMPKKAWLGAASPPTSKASQGSERKWQISHSSSDKFYRLPWAGGEPFQSIKVIEIVSFCSDENNF